MKLKDQVCSLEQSKRLVELGVIKPSLFTWKDWSFDEDGSEYRVTFTPEHSGCIPAYTVAELGEMLPTCVKSKNGDINLISTSKFQDCFNCVWEYNHQELATTEAQARAAMLIWLLENGIIQPNKTL